MCWETRKQGVIAVSSCEAEYVAMAHAVQEGFLLQKLFTDLYGKDVSANIILHVDNQGGSGIIKKQNMPTT